MPAGLQRHGDALPGRCHRQLPPGVQGGCQGCRRLHLGQFLGRLIPQPAPRERRVGRGRLRHRGREQRPLGRPCSLLECLQHAGAESLPERGNTLLHARLLPSNRNRHRSLRLTVGAVMRHLLPVLPQRR
ncbi:unnamed protein product [Musa acuminata subsp. malaccensis]|uniref:(wild Malaysian banana) hypothetical protein n=1 Tax=Musa acuminata subsp. malaccensis TaxID=214687 RepID=A0A804KDL6_MUSAM|nr:unnamed protein product [Musa acuminata subsp. malaccensis]